jgi:hypothetical protein
VIGVEIFGIEPVHVLVVFLTRHETAPKLLTVPLPDGIDTPVDKHPESAVEELPLLFACRRPGDNGGYRNHGGQCTFDVRILHFADVPFPVFDSLCQFAL